MRDDKNKRKEQSIKAESRVAIKEIRGVVIRGVTFEGNDVDIIFKPITSTIPISFFGPCEISFTVGEVKYLYH